MPRELRLAFAMGGGVSLGAFSGAALAETLKLALLYARDADGRPYDRVVVDVFSGASAGAMTLGVMLRTLVHQTDAQRAEAEARLESLYGGDFTSLQDPERRADLVAAQVVQDVQEAVWVHDISLDALLASGNDGARHEPAILDRAAVEAIARRRIRFPDGVDTSRRRLLGGGPRHDRVLFACTLSNASPILCDARSDLEAEEAGFIGLTDGLTSRAHRELRVFDLNFRFVPEKETTSERYPRRWCRYHHAEEETDRIGDLRRNRTWAKIAATGIAAGAFPFAFEPVVLTRRRYEYGDLWPRELEAAGRAEHPFTYVDGGTFNNEPIREAFRLASFIDAHNPDRAFDRCIVFVDPNARELQADFRVPIHAGFALRAANVLGSLDGVDLVRRASVDRLVPHVATLLSAILNEARGVEGDKIYHTRKRFALRDTVRKFVYDAVRDDPDDAILRDLVGFARGILERDERTSLIPAGTLTLRAELERVVAEEREEHPDLGVLAGRAAAFLDRPDPGADPDAALWLRMLVFVALDLVMDLEGKHPTTRLVAIAPFEHVRDPARRAPVALPGSRLFAFGGFTSVPPRAYEVRVARYCAREFLAACGVIPADGASEPAPRFEDWDAYRRDLRRGLSLLADRIGSMVRGSHLLPPGPLQLVLPALASAIEDKVRALGEERPERIRHEFRVAVPSKRFELDGRGLGDQDVRPIRLPGDEALYLVTCLDYEPASGRWTGPFVDEADQSIAISLDGRGPLPDRSFCRIALPPPARCGDASLLPNPIFGATVRERADRGKRLSADRWDRLDAGVTSLEDTLFA